MNQPTWEQITWMIGAIGTGVAFLAGPKTISSIITLGNWWYEKRKERIKLDLEVAAAKAKAEWEEEDRRAKILMISNEIDEKGYKSVVRRQDRRISELERIAENSNNAHHRCEQLLTASNVKCDLLEQDYNEVRQELENVKAKMELIAPGIDLDASDSHVQRFLERRRKIAERKKKERINKPEPEPPSTGDAP